MLLFNLFKILKRNDTDKAYAYKVNLKVMQLSVIKSIHANNFQL